MMEEGGGGGGGGRKGRKLSTYFQSSPALICKSNSQLPVNCYVNSIAYYDFAIYRQSHGTRIYWVLIVEGL